MPGRPPQSGSRRPPHLKAGLCGDPADECQIRGQAGFCTLKIHQMQIFGPGFPKAQRHRQRIRAVNGHLPVVSPVKPDGLPFIEIDGWKYVHGGYLTIRRMRAGWTGPPRRSFPDGTGSRRCFPGPRRRSDRAVFGNGCDVGTAVGIVAVDEIDIFASRTSRKIGERGRPAGKIGAHSSRYEGFYSVSAPQVPC